PERYNIAEQSIIMPRVNSGNVEVIRGPNIKSLPEMEELSDSLEVEVAIKVEDNISTDGIMPAGSKILPLRSNIEALSEFVFSRIDPGFHKTCKEKGNVAVIGGENYGQGSSREHAALAPRYLGVRVKIAKSFARIHKANLCNFGILPLMFKDASDYDRLEKGGTIILENIRNLIENNQKEIPVKYEGGTLMTMLDVSERQRKFLLAGGALNYVKNKIG
ncbi:aconitate hydratase, partial [Thermodesulfobacteriota bacterium]